MSDSTPIGLRKDVLVEGDQAIYPQARDTVTMSCTGWLFDKAKPQERGTNLDSSIGRGQFKTKIG